MGRTVIKVAVGIGELLVNVRSYSVVRCEEAKVQERNSRLADFKGVQLRRLVSGAKLYKLIKIL